jgi:methionine salvage enolase-phosphatase E1
MVSDENMDVNKEWHKGDNVHIYIYINGFFPNFNSIFKMSKIKMITTYFNVYYKCKCKTV